MDRSILPGDPAPDVMCPVSCCWSAFHVDTGYFPADTAEIQNNAETTNIEITIFFMSISSSFGGASYILPFGVTR